MTAPEKQTSRSWGRLPALVALALLLLIAAGAGAADRLLALGDPLVRAPRSAPQAAPALAPPAQYLPLIARPAGATLPITRDEARQLYETLYEPFGTAAVGWTGNHNSCDAGTTSAAFRQEVLDLVRYFRAMAGVPAQTVFDPAYNSKAQEAALMMSANGALSHDPPPDWACYTEAGAEAAGHSNLSWWIGYGSEYHGVLGQMEDDGEHNYAAGHRRWLLCPQTEKMGTGDIPQTGDYAAANALWVIDEDNFPGPRPETRDGFVAWPPPGYVPAPVIYARWSLSYPQADFSGAAVTMRRNGHPVSVALEPLVTSICEPALVWKPDVDWAALDLSQEQRFEVTVSGVDTATGIRSFSYEVFVFAP